MRRIKNQRRPSHRFAVTPVPEASPGPFPSVNLLRFLAVSSALAAGASGAAPADAPTPPNIAIAPLPPGATLRAATVRIIVAPDHRDWTYLVGETARFRITVTADNEPVDGMIVVYQIGPDLFPGPKTQAAVPPGGLTVEGTMKEPGFLRCIVM